MIDFLIPSFFGLISGIIVGLVPGLGLSTFLLLCFPYLISQSLLFCVVFYCVASATSQYFGSITTLTFGIPGETTSLPLFAIRDQIIDSNKFNEAHFLSCYGSFVASIISLFLFFAIFDFFSEIIFYLKSYIALNSLIVGLILCVFFSSNKKLVSIAFIILGWYAGKVGYDPLYNQDFLTFGNVYLYSGIPILPAVLGIYAIPNVIKMIYDLEQIKTIQFHYEKVFDKTNLALQHSFVAIRSSFIGFISGIIPYVGTSISSYLAFLIEKKLNPNKFLYQAIAAESANNSANISVLFPLLMLSVAIVPSEYILLEIVSNQNVSAIWSTITQNVFYILSCLLIINAICFLVSWNLINSISMIFFKAKRVLCFCMIFLILYGVYTIGFNYGQELYYVVVLLVFSIFGFLLRKHDLLPFVYCFLLQNHIQQIVYRVTTIYFG